MTDKPGDIPDASVEGQINDLFASVDLDYTTMAVTNRKVFLAHVQEGFTPEEALELVKTLMSTHLQTQMIIAHQEAHPDGSS